MKGGGGAKQNLSVEQGTQVSSNSNPDSRNHRQDRGDTFQPLHSQRPVKKEGMGRGKLRAENNGWMLVGQDDRSN